MKEKWVKLPGYKRDYELSNYGQIRYKKLGVFVYPKPRKRKHGNSYRLLKNNGGEKEFSAARLVLHHFKSPMCRGVIVNYKDGDIRNSHEKNLYWSLPSGLLDIDVVQIRKKHKPGKTSELAEEYGVCTDVIRSIVQNLVWPTAGVRSKPKIIKETMIDEDRIRAVVKKELRKRRNKVIGSLKPVKSKKKLIQLRDPKVILKYARRDGPTYMF